MHAPDTRSSRLILRSIVVALALLAGCADEAATPRTGIDAPNDRTDATVDDARADDRPTPGDVAIEDGGCPTSGVPVTGERCARDDAACYGRRYMCFTATERGPAGLERCRCELGTWQCTDTCRDWQATLRDR